MDIEMRMSTRRHPMHLILSFVQWNLDIMNLYLTMSSVLRTIFFTHGMIKYAKKNLEITKLRYTEQILPIPWPLVIPRFHCIRKHLEEISNNLVNAS